MRVDWFQVRRKVHLCEKEKRECLKGTFQAFYLGGCESINSLCGRGEIIHRLVNKLKTCDFVIQEQYGGTRAIQDHSKFLFQFPVHDHLCHEHPNPTDYSGKSLPSKQFLEPCIMFTEQVKISNKVKLHQFWCLLQENSNKRFVSSNFLL